MSKTLKYSLEKWNFKRNTYYGSVAYRATHNLSDIILDEGVPLTVNEMKILEEKVSQKIISLLSYGHSVKIWELLTLQPVIKGTFKGKKDHFDPMRHSLQVEAVPSFKLKEIHRLNLFKITKVDSFRRECRQSGYIDEENLPEQD
jgi:hypothetical protein